MRREDPSPITLHSWIRFVLALPLEKLHVMLLEAKVTKSIIDPLPHTLLVGREKDSLASRLITRRFFMVDPRVCVWNLGDRAYRQWYPEQYWGNPDLPPADLRGHDMLCSVPTKHMLGHYCESSH